MSSERETSAAAWLNSHADVTLPAERLPAFTQSTAAACTSVAALTGGLAMEDEPAGYVLALARLAGPKP